MYNASGNDNNIHATELIRERNEHCKSLVVVSRNRFGIVEVPGSVSSLLEVHTHGVTNPPFGSSILVHERQTHNPYTCEYMNTRQVKSCSKSKIFIMYVYI